MLHSSLLTLNLLWKEEIVVSANILSKITEMPDKGKQFQFTNASDYCLQNYCRNKCTLLWCSRDCTVKPPYCIPLDWHFYYFVILWRNSNTETLGTYLSTHTLHLRPEYTLNKYVLQRRMRELQTRCSSGYNNYLCSLMGCRLWV